MCVKYVRSGAEPRDHLERLGDAEVRRVRPVAQRVEHERRARRRAAATTLSGIALQSVRYANAPRRKPRIGRGPCRSGTGTISTPPSVNGPAISDSASCGMPPPRCAGGVEDVRERPPQIGERLRVGEAGHRRALQDVEAADLVEAEDVIGVAVREEDRVHAA